VEWSVADIAKMIDHSVLKPESTEEDLSQGCRIALEHDVATVCLLPYYVKECSEILRGSDVRTCTTVGFPHGCQAASVKMEEARRCLDDGAEELDMVVNISKVLSADWSYVRAEIEALVDLVHDQGGKLKVIFENCYLDRAQKVRLCEICGELGVDWVKTSTGFGTSGATLEDLELMRTHSPPSVQLKAAGGVRDLDTVLRARDIGATRIGTSATVTILEECRARVRASEVSGL
jgi:deoxyribose-phosphate aldolase